MRPERRFRQERMGTSTWQRSPETEAWRRVRELYTEPSPSPSEVASRIVAAIDPQTREAMSDAAVTTCLGTLIEGARIAERDGLPSLLADLGVGTEPAAVQTAAGLRGRAESLIVKQGVASRFGDLALDATATTAFAMAARSTGDAGLLELPLSVVADNFAACGREGELHRTTSLFVGHDLDSVFRYFVARDLPDFIGGAGLPTVAEASQLEDAVAAHCRNASRELDLSTWEENLAEVIDLPPRERVQQLSPVLAAGIDRSLDVLAAGVA